MGPAEEMAGLRASSGTRAVGALEDSPRRPPAPADPVASPAQVVCRYPALLAVVAPYPRPVGSMLFEHGDPGPVHEAARGLVVVPRRGAQHHALPISVDNTHTLVNFRRGCCRRPRGPG